MTEVIIVVVRFAYTYTQYIVQELAGQSDVWLGSSKNPMCLWSFHGQGYFAVSNQIVIDTICKLACYVPPILLRCTQYAKSDAV